MVAPISCSRLAIKPTSCGRTPNQRHCRCLDVTAAGARAAPPHGAPAPVRGSVPCFSMPRVAATGCGDRGCAGAAAAAPVCAGQVATAGGACVEGRGTSDGGLSASQYSNHEPTSNKVPASTPKCVCEVAMRQNGWPPWVTTHKTWRVPSKCLLQSRGTVSCCTMSCCTVTCCAVSCC
jgi:hypothetical protein